MDEAILLDYIHTVESIFYFCTQVYMIYELLAKNHHSHRGTRLVYAYLPKSFMHYTTESLYFVDHLKKEITCTAYRCVLIVFADSINFFIFSIMRTVFYAVCSYSKYSGTKLTFAIHYHICFLSIPDVVIFLVLQKAPRWNVRSYPKRIHNLLNGLSTEQKKIFLEDTGFDKLLQFKLERNIPPAFLQWLYKRIDHHTMTIRLGPGKELKLTKEVFYRILGLPKTGAQQEKIEEWSLRKDEAKDLRKALKITELKEFNPDILIQHVKKKGTDELTKRCFFIVLFNCMLFCTGSWVISNNEIMRTADMSNFHKIDWCHEIYTFFVHQMELFANDLKKPQVSYTIPGCSVAVAVRTCPHPLIFLFNAFFVLLLFNMVWVWMYTHRIPPCCSHDPMVHLANTMILRFTPISYALSVLVMCACVLPHGCKFTRLLDFLRGARSVRQ